MSPTWDPERYLQFADERSRPFVDLVARVRTDAPVRVVDLGCGPGQLTASLAERWPRAEILGVDSSVEMITRAERQRSERVRFVAGDLTEWRAEPPVDVIVSNATLQWVPGHRRLLGRLVDQLTDGGWLAFQVPGNFGEPSHVLLHELAEQEPYAEFTTGLERPGTADPVDYLSDLLALGCTAEVWETTYLHLLPGPDPVFRWVSGTGARPVLQALPDRLRPGFEDIYKSRLRQAYPAGPFGTVLPYRRVFAVAQTRSGPTSTDQANEETV